MYNHIDFLDIAYSVTSWLILKIRYQSLIFQEPISSSVGFLHYLCLFIYMSVSPPSQPAPPTHTGYVFICIQTFPSSVHCKV